MKVGYPYFQVDNNFCMFVALFSLEIFVLSMLLKLQWLCMIVVTEMLGTSNTISDNPSKYKLLILEMKLNITGSHCTY